MNSCTMPILECLFNRARPMTSLEISKQVERAKSTVYVANIS